MVKLSDRLEKICNSVEPGEIVADIGTDHGLLPLALFERGISPYMILTDVRQGPLEKVRNNLDHYFQRYELQRRYVIIDRSSEYEHSKQVAETVNTPQTTIRNSEAEKGISCFDIRLGSGLEVLAHTEVDTAVIAGIGGLLILELLNKDQRKTRSIKKLILQPRIAADKLRRWLSENGYHISKDELAMEYGRINEIITVCNNGNVSARTSKLSMRNKSRKVCDNNEVWEDNIKSCVELLRESGLIYEISEELLWRCDPLLPEFLSIRIERNKKIINQIKQSGKRSAGENKLTRMEAVTDAYSTVLRMINKEM